jgi:hypothetical protein
VRRIFGPNREEVAGGWRMLHDEFIKPEAKRTCGRCRHRWKDNEDVD